MLRFRLSAILLSLAAVAATPAAAVASTPAGQQQAAACDGHDLVPMPDNLVDVRAATLCLVNVERARHGLSRLEQEGVLQGVATGYARRMVRERFFGHVAPDGATLTVRVRRTTYLQGALRRWTIGENLAWGTGPLATPASIVRGWMRSPAHRRNILTGHYTELGLGIALGAPKRDLGDRPAATYVNEFGERRR